MNNAQKQTVWKVIGMLWTLASMKDNPFAEIAADFAEDLFIAFRETGVKENEND